jgi:hypothetical protein
MKSHSPFETHVMTKTTFENQNGHSIPNHQNVEQKNLNTFD